MSENQQDNQENGNKPNEEVSEILERLLILRDLRVFLQKKKNPNEVVNRGDKE